MSGWKGWKGAEPCSRCWGVPEGTTHDMCPHDDCPKKNPPSVLEEAAELVNGDRQQAYGHPRDNHACTAALWNAYIERTTHAGTMQLDAFDVCMLNILQKVSRLAHSRHRDGLVDLAGFAANADMVDER